MASLMNTDWFQSVYEKAATIQNTSYKKKILIIISIFLSGKKLGIRYLLRMCFSKRQNTDFISVLGEGEWSTHLQITTTKQHSRGNERKQ